MSDCPINGCKAEPFKKNPMCWRHLDMVTPSLQKTLVLLANDGTGKPRPGYDEACANAIEQVRQAIDPAHEVLDPYTNWPFRGAQR